MKKLIVIFILLICSQVFASGGYDLNSKARIDVEPSPFAINGSEVEIYNYSTGEYSYAEVDTIYDNGDSSQLGVYDYDSGKYKTIEVNDRLDY